MLTHFLEKNSKSIIDSFMNVQAGVNQTMELDGCFISCSQDCFANAEAIENDVCDKKSSNIKGKPLPLFTFCCTRFKMRF